MKALFFIVGIFLFTSCEQEKNILREEVKTSFPPREELITQLKEEPLDILIIGGGATGAGALLDATTRGLKVGLVEAQDYASGTSSRSTKLVHGGVRYLERAFKSGDLKELGLVRTALTERYHFLKNAPHLTNALPIFVPVNSLFSAIYYYLGLKMYDLIAGGSLLKPTSYISAEEAKLRFPQLKDDSLRGGVVYYDGQFNDARMNVALILTAVQRGAIAVNHMRVIDLIKEDNLVTGVLARDELTSKVYPIYAKAVINATGPFSDSIQRLEDPEISKTISPSEGTHLILDQELAAQNVGLLIPKTKDGRVLFLLPWLGKTLVGTTDASCEISETPTPTNQDIDFILRSVEDYFSVILSTKNVLAAWCGIRPLVLPDNNTETSRISRDHTIRKSHGGVVSIAGGKWTTYRKMAQDLIDFTVIEHNLPTARDSQTLHLPLIGAHEDIDRLTEQLQEERGIEKKTAFHLVQNYGTESRNVLKFQNLNQKLHPDYPYLESEIVYSARNEYAESAMDILARRLRLAFLDHKATQEVLPRVIELLAFERSWDKERIEQEFSESQNFLNTMIVY